MSAGGQPSPRAALAEALSSELVATLRAADVADTILFTASEAAAWAPTLGADDRRALALLVVALQVNRAAGSTRLELGEGGLAALLERLEVPLAERQAAVGFAAGLPSAREAGALFGVPGAYKPFIVDGSGLYAHRDWLLEERLADALARRLAAPALEGLAAADEDAGPAARRWTSEQERALRRALGRPLTVISGGPGTGKTALMAGIVRGLGQLGIPIWDIALAAPTGKAANRIAESLRAALGDAPAPEAQTLHRLLGYRGGSARARSGEFRHHENFPLPHRAVLVDEASMIDLELMERLARAVRPDARLVLLGDADQLPSVDAGAVFRELGPVAARLTQSHRQDPSAPAGASVLAAARAVHEGDLAALQVSPRARPADLTWSGFEHLAPTGAAPGAERRLVAAFVDHWYQTRVRALPDFDALVSRLYRAPFDAADAAALARLLTHHQSLRLLAVTRGAGFATSAEALNAALTRRAAADAGVTADAAEPLPGTPVLMTRNDYDRGLFNGDQGVVVRASVEGGAPRATAVFPRASGLPKALPMPSGPPSPSGQPPAAGLAAFPFDGLREDLRVAYATTVHKAQGAELDHVALVLPERDLPLLSRELLYTALTRARRSAVVVGRWDLLALAASRPLARASGLAERLIRRGALSDRP